MGSRWTIDNGEAKVHPMSNLITQSLGSPQEMPNPEIKIFDIRQETVSYCVQMV